MLVIAALTLAQGVSAVAFVDSGPFGAWRIEVPNPAAGSCCAKIAIDDSGIVSVLENWVDRDLEQTISGIGGITYVGIHTREAGVWDTTLLPVCKGSRDLVSDALEALHALCVLGPNSDQIQYLSSTNGWSAEFVGVSSWPSLGVGPDGVPHVVYDKKVDGVHEVKWATRIAEGSWATETVVANRQVRSGDVVIEPDGTAYILAQGVNPDLGLYIQSKPSGGSWKETPVPDCYAVAFHFDVDADGGIHVACEAFGRSLYYMRLTNGTWTESLVTTDSTDVVQIRARPDGTVGLLTVFRDGIGRSVGYTSMTPAGWVRERIGPTLDADPSRSLDMTFDGAGRPHVAYTLLSYAHLDRAIPSNHADLHYATPVVSAIPAAT